MQARSLSGQSLGEELLLLKRTAASIGASNNPVIADPDSRAVRREYEGGPLPSAGDSLRTFGLDPSKLLRKRRLPNVPGHG